MEFTHAEEDPAKSAVVSEHCKGLIPCHRASLACTGVNPYSLFFPETTEVSSQPVYATVQKKNKNKPEEDKLSGETHSKRLAGNFYSHFFSFSCCLA